MTAKRTADLSSLTAAQRHLLGQVGEVGGTTVCVLSLPTCLFGNTRRSAVMYATNDLKQLERRRLVKRLDDERPIAWLRTADGTAKLNQTES